MFDISMHMRDNRISFLQDMCSHSQSWIYILQYFIDNKRMTHGGQWLEHYHGRKYLMEVFHLKYLVLHELNTWLSNGMMCSPYLYGRHP